MKPDSAVPREIVKHLNIPSQAFFSFGESDAVMFPVEALWGFHSEKKLWDSVADKVISRPDERLKFVS
jgi:hypothetical protein